MVDMNDHHLRQFSLGKVRGEGEQKVLIAAELLQTLVRSRRFHLDELLEGDGPYWISIGLYINEERGVETRLDQIVELADESIEASRHILRLLIDHGVVQAYITGGGEAAYRLAPRFSASFGRYLLEQFGHMQFYCARS